MAKDLSWLMIPEYFVPTISDDSNECTTITTATLSVTYVFVMLSDSQSPFVFFVSIVQAFLRASKERYELIS